MERVTTILDEFLAFVGNIPLHWAYLIGAGVAVGLGTSITVAVITYRKKWKEAEKYAKEFIGFLLVAIGFVMSAAVYVVTNASDITKMLTVPDLADFATTALPAWGIALGIANQFYTFGGSRLYQRFYDKIAPKLTTWAQQREDSKSAVRQPVFKTSLPKPHVVVSTTNSQDEDIFASDTSENLPVSPQ